MAGIFRRSVVQQKRSTNSTDFHRTKPNLRQTPSDIWFLEMNPTRYFMTQNGRPNGRRTYFLHISLFSARRQELSSGGAVLDLNGSSWNPKSWKALGSITYDGENSKVVPLRFWLNLWSVLRDVWSIFCKPPYFVRPWEGVELLDRILLLAFSGWWRTRIRSVLAGETWPL